MSYQDNPYENTKRRYPESNLAEAARLNTPRPYGLSDAVKMQQDIGVRLHEAKLRLNSLLGKLSTSHERPLGMGGVKDQAVAMGFLEQLQEGDLNLSTQVAEIEEIISTLDMLV